MTLTMKKKLSPFFGDTLLRNFENFPALIEKESTEFFPAINLIEDDKRYIIELAVPGYSKKEFNIDIDERRIIISAEKEDKMEEMEENYTRKEFSYHHFQRSFLLPKNVDEKSIEAKFIDGLLKLKLDKVEIEDQVNMRHIDIK